ncbi:hypothetical protein AAZX31_04G107900 [Glycine max]
MVDTSSTRCHKLHIWYRKGQFWRGDEEKMYM